MAHLPAGFRPGLQSEHRSLRAMLQCPENVTLLREESLGVKLETEVSSLEVEYLILYLRHLIGVQQANCIKSPSQEKS